ncbi:MAG: hypothetical protein PW734_04415 [Verrucomicrobium sp.]|nr:hypothetical protein [Verrucomicrobium sp.]
MEKKKVLLLAASDPRQGGRVAEAFRVADGLSIADELDVALLLTGAAAQAFAEKAGLSQDWQDGAGLLRHLAALRRRHIPLFVEGEARAALEEAGIKTAAPGEAEALRRNAAVVIEF